MSAEDNKAVVRRFMEECYNPGQFDRMDQFFAPGLAVHDPAAPQVCDLESLRQFFLMQHSAFPDRYAMIDDLLADGDKVVKRTTFRGTQTGELAGIPPTGKPVTTTVISIYRLMDGTIQELWWGYDNLSIMQQLGVLPTAEHAHG